MIAHAVIGWIGFFTTGVTYTGADDSMKTPEPGVRTPESTQGECRGFEALRFEFVNRWDGHLVSFIW
jgi:hypothetical protein